MKPRFAQRIGIEDELLALETGALDPARFPHPEHVRLGYEMLGRYPFGEAVTRFSRGLRLLAAKGGRPEIYHETITVAFLAVIGERRARGGHDYWDEFKANNGDLLDKRCLERWYGRGAAPLRFGAARRFVCLRTAAVEASFKERRFENRRVSLVGGCKPPLLDGYRFSAAAGAASVFTRMARNAPKSRMAALQSCAAVSRSPKKSAESPRAPAGQRSCRVCESATPTLRMAM